MSEVCSSKRSSKPIKTPCVSFVLDLVDKPPKSGSVGVFEFNKRWHFYVLAFIWLFLNQVKRLTDVDCNFETTASKL